MVRAAAASARSALTRLDRLDERVLPVAARILDAASMRVRCACDGLVSRAGDIVARAVHGTSSADPSGRPVAGRRDADRAFPGRGMRIVERGMRTAVLGAVGVITVSMVAALVRGPAAGRPEGRAPTVIPPGKQADPTGTTPTASTVPATVQVGPRPDEPVDGYLTAARMRLAALAADPEQPDTYAVVSFPGYRTPEQALGLLRDFRTVRVFFRVPPDGPTLSADVHDPVADVRAAFDGAAEAAARRAAASTDDDARQLATDEAAALRDSCACLYGAVVRAPAGRLVALAGLASIRLVDAAPPGTVASPATAVFTALRPEQR